MKKLIGILLIVLGIGILTYPWINIWIDKIGINESISEWDKKIVERKNYEKTSEKINSEKGNIDDLTIINGKSIIGKIIVSKTGEQIPVINGATEENLKYGATLYNNGIYPGDKGTAIILGHRETTFGFLENIKIGDEIQIETLNNKYKFILEETYIVNPDDPLILKQESYPSVTLDTCYPFHYFGGAPNRFIAKFKLI
ncbi:class D sortase [Clostridium perfringens]|uniref:class D sortase n=1 Tax=Clostridium perfringens TaxID=1502 RepID=UPI000DA2A84B|nr:class D sortase [Clostridium perfringens]SQI05413.1 sortase family protein [Clostridium perfringens]